ncbi:hypothetical protein WA158_003601 [Blastocystis sp. Blastoise]
MDAQRILLSLNIDGVTREMYAQNNRDILYLKQKIQRLFGIQTSRQTLYYRNQELTDDYLPLQDLHLTSLETLYISDSIPYIELTLCYENYSITKQISKETPLSECSCLLMSSLYKQNIQFKEKEMLICTYNGIHLDESMQILGYKYLPNHSTLSFEKVSYIGCNEYEQPIYEKLNPAVIWVYLEYGNKYSDIISISILSTCQSIYTTISILYNIPIENIHLYINSTLLSPSSSIYNYSIQHLNHIQVKIDLLFIYENQEYKKEIDPGIYVSELIQFWQSELNCFPLFLKSSHGFLTYNSIPPLSSETSSLPLRVFPAVIPMIHQFDHSNQFLLKKGFIINTINIKTWNRTQIMIEGSMRVRELNYILLGEEEDMMKEESTIDNDEDTKGYTVDSLISLETLYIYNGRYLCLNDTINRYINEDSTDSTITIYYLYIPNIFPNISPIDVSIHGVTEQILMESLKTQKNSIPECVSIHYSSSVYTLFRSYISNYIYINVMQSLSSLHYILITEDNENIQLTVDPSLKQSDSYTQFITMMIPWSIIAEDIYSFVYIFKHNYFHSLQIIAFKYLPLSLLSSIIYKYIYIYIKKTSLHFPMDIPEKQEDIHDFMKNLSKPENKEIYIQFMLELDTIDIRMLFNRGNYDLFDTIYMNNYVLLNSLLDEENNEEEKEEENNEEENNEEKEEEEKEENEKGQLNNKQLYNEQKYTNKNESEEEEEEEEIKEGGVDIESIYFLGEQYTIEDLYNTIYRDTNENSIPSETRDTIMESIDLDINNIHNLSFYKNSIDECNVLLLPRLFQQSIYNLHFIHEEDIVSVNKYIYYLLAQQNCCLTTITFQDMPFPSSFCSSLSTSLSSSIYTLSFYKIQLNKSNIDSIQHMLENSKEHLPNLKLILFSNCTFMTTDNTNITTTCQFNVSSSSIRVVFEVYLYIFLSIPNSMH